MGHEKFAINVVPPVEADGNTVAATVQLTRFVLCSMTNSGDEVKAAFGKVQFSVRWPEPLVVMPPPTGNGGGAMVTAISCE